MTFRTDKCIAHLTPEQNRLFAQHAGVCRLIYNIALEQRETWWRHIKRQTGKNVSFISQSAELTQLRAEFDFIQEVSQEAEQRVLKNLDKAFTAFFSGRARYPRRKRKNFNEAFSFPGRACPIRKINSKWSMIRLPKIGEVKIRTPRKPPSNSRVYEINCVRDDLGWHVCIGNELTNIPYKHTLPEHIAVGIDRGVKNNIATSDGDLYSLDLSIEDTIYKQAQRIISRRKKGSKRRLAAIKHASHIAARTARKRKHFNHVITSKIVHENRIIVIEDLNIQGMMKSIKGSVEKPIPNVAAKTRLNRSIANAAWFQFETFLTYKTERDGVKLIKINPAYTSQTCPCCGSIDRGNRESQAKFSCLSCGHEDHADVNAAVNILMAGTQPAASKTANQRLVNRTSKNLLQANVTSEVLSKSQS